MANTALEGTGPFQRFVCTVIKLEIIATLPQGMSSPQMSSSSGFILVSQTYHKACTPCCLSLTASNLPILFGDCEVECAQFSFS